MIIPIKSANLFKLDCGDILCGEEYIDSLLTEEDFSKNYISLSSIGNDTWHSLQIFNIKINELQKEFEYECPFNNNKYFWFVPSILLLTSTTDPRLIYGNNLSNQRKEFIFDFGWTRQMKSGRELSGIQKAFLGHGYTVGTLPSDGSNELIQVKIKLNNNDFIGGYCYVWYNK